MNKKQLIVMWIGILWFSLRWGTSLFYEDYGEEIPIIVVVIAGLLITLSDKNKNTAKEICHQLPKSIIRGLTKIKEWTRDTKTQTTKKEENRKDD